MTDTLTMRLIEVLYDRTSMRVALMQRSETFEGELLMKNGNENAFVCAFSKT